MSVREARRLPLARVEGGKMTRPGEAGVWVGRSLLVERRTGESDQARGT